MHAHSLHFAFKHKPTIIFYYNRKEAQVPATFRTCVLYTFSSSRKERRRYTMSNASSFSLLLFFYILFCFVFAFLVLVSD